MPKNELTTISGLSALGDIEVTKQLVESNEFADSYEALKAAIDLLSTAKKNLDSKIKDVIEPLYAEDGTATIVNAKYNFTYVSASTRVTVDGAKLKKEYPDVYAKCVKTSATAPSMRVTERKAENADGE